MPRQTNIGLFRQLHGQNPGLRPLVGLDFHKRSDYASVFIEAQCDSPAEVLAAIRGGNYSLQTSDGPLNVYPERQTLRTLATNANRAVYTWIYDFAVTQHRWLARQGFTVPKSFKTALKRIF